MSQKRCTPIAHAHCHIELFAQRRSALSVAERRRSAQLSVVESRHVGKSTARPNLFTDVQTLLHKLNFNITFVWIPSHVGIAGNELADVLAGITNQKPNIELEENLELQEAYLLVDKHILDLWQQKWITCATGFLYRQLVPTVSNDIKYTNAVRRKTWLLQDSN